MKEKLKKYSKPFFIILLLTFIPTFIVSLTGYYEEIENKQSRLTKDAMEQFEKDVSKGEKIIASNYLVEQKNYDNLISRLSIKTGDIIELLFNKAMKAILKEVEQALK